MGGVQASQIQRRLRLDDSFSQGKREVNVILTTDYTIYCFLIRNWKGNLSPGSDGKFWIERQETEENVNVRQFPSPLVDAEQQVKLLHRFGQNYLLRSNLKYLLYKLGENSLLKFNNVGLIKFNHHAVGRILEAWGLN